MNAEQFFGDDLKGYTSLNGKSEWALKRFYGWTRHATYATVCIDSKDLSKEETNTHFTNLKKSVNDAQFSYIPIKKCKIKKLGHEDNSDITYEDSLMIFSCNATRSIFTTDKMLLDFVISLFKIYNDKGTNFLKEQFVFKSKDKTLFDLYDSAGKIISTKGDILIDGLDNTDIFEEDKTKIVWFITSQPMCYSERHVRALKGELF